MAHHAPPSSQAHFASSTELAPTQNSTYSQFIHAFITRYTTLQRVFAQSCIVHLHAADLVDQCRPKYGHQERTRATVCQRGRAWKPDSHLKLRAWRSADSYWPKQPFSQLKYFWLRRCESHHTYACAIVCQQAPSLAPDAHQSLSNACAAQ